MESHGTDLNLLLVQFDLIFGLMLIVSPLKSTTVIGVENDMTQSHACFECLISYIRKHGS